MGTAFNNRHRYFIQFMLTNGLASKQDALQFLTKISPEESSLAHLKMLIIEINREIGNHFYKIAPTVCEISGEHVFVWLNVKNDEISRQQSGFSSLELQYFHAIMQEIITAEEHCIPYPRAVNISSTLTSSLSRENGEKALIKWFRGGYFVKNEGNVYLGPRTILEFTAYLRTNTENCNCNLCSELVFVGDTCNTCKNTFHNHCLAKYLQHQETCPNCKASWESSNNSAYHMETDPQLESSQNSD